MFRQITKTKSLRLVSVASITIIFACLVVSFIYLDRELSYDRFHTKADRIARLHMAFDNQEPDGRLLGQWQLPILGQVPQIEELVVLEKINTAILQVDDRKDVVKDMYFVSQNLFEVFDFELVADDTKTALASPNNILISEKMALRLYRTTDVVGKPLTMYGRKFNTITSTITGVFGGVN